VSGAGAGERLQLLTFAVAQEQYAIDVHRVREVVEALAVTRVPSTPAVIRGVVNLRGTVVPLLDLRARFGAGALPSGKRSCIIVAELPERDATALAGLLVDAVSSVVELDAGEVAPPPAFGILGGRDLVRGIVRVDAKLVLILDVDAVVPACSAEVAS
jgi:purine-binding chemotaxis protein CheW